MKDCCQLEIRNNKILKILWVVLFINLTVFFGQFIAAIIANSSSLLADSIDMMGDVLAYAITIYAFNKGDKWQARASLFKGVVIFILASIVFIDVAKQIFDVEILPSSSLMLIFSLIGLTANSICLWLLTAYQHDNLNMKSVWICSRNDILVNLSVIFTAILVFYFQSKWPDIIVGSALAILLYKSAMHIIRLSIAALNK